MTGPAQFKSAKTKRYSPAPARQSLVIEGERVEIADVMQRTGRTKDNLLRLHRDGKRTWGELERRG